MGPIYFFATLLFLLSLLATVHLILDPSFLSHLSALRLFLSFIIPTLTVGSAVKKKNLSKSGALIAWYFGFVLTNFSYIHTILMLVFFFTCSKLTKFKKERKKKIEYDYETAAQRDWRQVVANGGVALMFAFLSILKFGLASEKPIDLKNNYYSSWYDLAIIGSLAFATGDTWASEVGTAIGSTNPVLISTLKRVPAGVNGAISLGGTMASFLGGLLMGVTYYICCWCFCSNFIRASHPSQLPVIIVATVCGFCGSLLDSLLGATLQFSGIDVKTNRVVQEPGSYVTKVCGRNILSNNSVNLLASLITALMAPYIAQLFV